MSVLTTYDVSALQDPEAVADSRRRLLQRGSGDAFESTESIDVDFDSAEAEDEYFGYRISAFQDDLRATADLSKAAIRNRYIGAPDRNRVLGGVLVHQIRSAVDSTYCDNPTEGPLGGRLPGAKFTKLGNLCAQHAFLKSLQDNGTYFKKWEEVNRDPVHPFGSDPMWIRSSRLFKPNLGGSEGDFYNMTEGSDEVSKFSGMMLTHFPREVPGKDLGFPLYIDTALDEIRLAETLLYVEDSNYLDSKSQELTIQMGVFNPVLQVFGAALPPPLRPSCLFW